MTNTWFKYIDLNEYYSKKINFLNLSAGDGSVVVSFAETYGKHVNSKYYCIDPWEDYSDYSGNTKYKTQRETTFALFLDNINSNGITNKVVVTRGYSIYEIPKFVDSFFDIIYVNGHTTPDLVLEELVLSFRKLISGGIIVFDDFYYGGPDEYTRAIYCFTSGYYSKIKVLGEEGSKVFIQKI